MEKPGKTTIKGNGKRPTRKLPAPAHSTTVVQLPKKGAKRKSVESMISGTTNTSTNAISTVLASTVRPENQMTNMEKMEATKAGFTKKQLEQLKQKAGLDYDQLAYLLGVARATLINKKGRERFSATLSEKIMSLADIYSYGYSVFEDQHQFNQWIFQPIAALGGKAPYELLYNQYGREEVKNIIGRMEYGVYS